MCHALPAKVLEVLDDGASARVDLGGVRKTISLGLVDDVVPGDFVVVHVGYALSKLDQAEAERTLALMAGYASTGGEEARP